MEETYRDITDPLYQENFKTSSASPDKLKIGNLVRWVFSALFAWNGGRMRRLLCTPGGVLCTHPAYEKPDGQDLLAAVAAATDTTDFGTVRPRLVHVGGSGVGWRWYDSDTAAALTRVRAVTGYSRMCFIHTEGRYLDGRNLDADDQNGLVVWWNL